MASVRVLTLASIYQVCVVVLSSLCCLFVRPDLTLAVAVGGMLMTANFVALRLLAARALKGAHVKLAYAVALAGKFAVVAGLLALLVIVFEIDVLGLVLGMSSLFLGVGLAIAHVAFSSQPGSELDSRTT
jgi:hypothetical protein